MSLPKVSVHIAAFICLLKLYDMHISQRAKLMWNIYQVI